MHLAESNDEMQLLENHQGPFRELLEQLGLWTDENFSTCSCPGDFLELLSNASRALIVHGNYLNRDDLHRIRTQSNVLKLVYCPRTHNFFGHEQYPLEWIRQLGIELALGTDSRASNPDLSIWNEMEFLLENQSEFSPLEILRLGTLNGAKALGLEDSLGTLQPGKLARLFVAPLAGESHLGRAIIESA